MIKKLITALSEKITGIATRVVGIERDHIEQAPYTIFKVNNLDIEQIKIKVLNGRVYVAYTKEEFEIISSTYGWSAFTVFCKINEEPVEIEVIDIEENSMCGRVRVTASTGSALHIANFIKSSCEKAETTVEI